MESETELLLKGSKVWNSWRRSNPGLKPDFSGLNLKRIGNVAVSQDTKSPIYDGLSTRDVRLVDYNLSEGNFEGAELEDVWFEGCILRRACFVSANLKGATFRGCDLELADLRLANLQSVRFMDSSIKGANVRTIVGAGGDPKYTSIQHISGLRQKKFETLNGDNGLITPNHLNIPRHWPLWNASNSGKGIGEEDREKPTEHAVVAVHITKNVGAIRTSLDALAIQIAMYRADALRNLYSQEEREERLDFAHKLEILLSKMQTICVNAESGVDSAIISEDAFGFLDSYLPLVRQKVQEYVTPQNLADATVPTSLILSCAAFGGWIFGPVGFGAGLFLGNVVTKQMKPKVSRSDFTSPEE